MNKKNNQRVSTPLIFIYIFFFAIIFVYVFFSGQKLLRLAQDVSNPTVNQSVRALSRSIDNKINAVNELALSPILRDESIEKRRKLFHAQSNSELQNTERIFIINSDGFGISNFDEAIDFTDHHFYKYALSEAMIGNSTFIEVDSGILQGDDPLFIITAPIYALRSDHELSGILYVSTKIETLSQITSDILESYDADIITVSIISTSENGNIRFISGNIEQNLNFDPLDKNNLNLDSPFYEFASLLNAAAITSRTGQETFELNNVSYYSFYERIPNTTWTVFAFAPESNSISSTDTSLFLLSFIILVALGIWIFIFILDSHKLYANLRIEQNKTLNIIEAVNLVQISINKSCKLKDVNNNFLSLTGYRREDILDTNIISIVVVNYKSEFEKRLKGLMEGKRIINIDIPILKKDGSELFLLWSATPSELTNADTVDEVYEILATNITEIKEYEKNIRTLAYYNSLTGLPNATYLREYVGKLINAKVRFMLVLLDLDNFKNINDILGHSKGDIIIEETTKRILSVSVDDVFVSCTGGDKFVMVVKEDEGFEMVDDYTSTLLGLVRQEYFLDELKINISCSIGISFFPENSDSYSGLYSRAEIAMSKTKLQGKGQAVFFNTEMKNELEKAILLEHDLKEAIKNEEFVLYYQPQYSLETGKLYGFEALIRWISPTRGFVPPDIFIPSAEKNQLIIPIGKWVMREAARFLKELESIGEKDISIAINVSPTQFMKDSFVESSLNILSSVGVELDKVKFELTESVMLDSVENNLSKIKTLNSKGINFALDDFGTGYSSLTYLTKIPIQFLKIDKSFVATILDIKDDKKAIISTILELASGIDVKVVAEGVEEKEQLDWLIKRGCDICQGYHTGRPLPRIEAMKVLGNSIF